MTDSDPVATIEALPYAKRAEAALDDAFLGFCATLDKLSLERVKARLRGCSALSKGWEKAVQAHRPKPAGDIRHPAPGCDWMDELRRGDGGKPLASTMNAGLIFRHWPPLETLRLNQLTLEAELHGKTWTDADTTRWTEQIERTFEVCFSKDTIDAMVEAVAEERAYHPHREYLDKLPAWDGKDYFDILAREIFGSTDPLARRFVECWLVGAVARTYKPGEKVDTVFTLYSAKHGTAKTTGIEAIFRNQVYIGDIDPSNKDHALSFATCSCVTMDEVDEFTRRSTWSAIKRMLSQRWDIFRAPYARRPRKWMRQFVFAATTNRDDILHDETGSRRWHIVHVSEMEPVERIRRIHAVLDQLWAQARNVWMAGTNNGTTKPRDYLWWLTPDEERLREAGAKQFEERSVVDDKVEFYVSQYDAKGENDVKMSDVLISALGVDRDKVAREKGLERAAAAVLRRLGYVSIKEGSARVWRRKKASNGNG